ncbi:MAG: LuxR C-terminal-related transcriptional regulator [Pedococcus sp.]
MSDFSLSVSDVGHLRAVMDLCTAHAAGQQDTEGLQATVWAVLEELQALMGCEEVTLNGLSPRTQSTYHEQTFAAGELFAGVVEDATDPSDDPFWRHYPDCRPCEYPDHVNGSAIVLHADFYSPREWLSHPMHLEYLTDVYDEMLLAIPDGEGRSVRLLFPRGRGKRFGDRERFALTLLAPHLEPLLLAARTAPPVPRLPVTERQWQILERVRLGLANKQIARELELSPGTVRKHLENIYRSLDVQSRGAAVHVAFGDTDGPFQQVAS